MTDNTVDAIHETVIDDQRKAIKRAEQQSSAAEAKIAAGAEERKAIQERRDDLEKAKEFDKITAKNAALAAAKEKEQAALNAAKTGQERIRIRQQMEAGRAAENERITLANRGLTAPTGRQPITPGSIKDSIRKAVAKTPATADRMVTGIFGNTAENFVNPQPPKVSPTQKSQYKVYRNETKLMSKVVNKKQVTGGNVHQVMLVQPGQIFPNPNFAE